MKPIILGILNERSGDGVTLKKLKKLANSQAQVDSIEEDFDEVFEKLQSKGKVEVGEDGTVSAARADSKSSKRKRDDVETAIVVPEPKASKKAESSSASTGTKSATGKAVPNNYPKELWKTGETLWRENGFDYEYLRTNPENITRLFCGNLSKTVTEEQLKGCIEGITYIKWITDKETKQFYGSTFLQMKDPKAAIEAVMKDKQKFMGRPLKIYYCPPRPGDVWPPKDAQASSSKPAGRQKTPKPPGCKKLYAGNLSYCIDDDAIVDFFKDCGTLVGLRWLTRQGTEEFRGCGFVEFATTEEAEKAFALDGKELMGRPIRLDWTE